MIFIYLHCFAGTTRRLPAQGNGYPFARTGEDRAGMRPSFIQQEEIEGGGQETDAIVLKGTRVAACAERAGFAALVFVLAGAAWCIQVHGRAALNQGMGPSRAAVISQGGVEDSGQRSRVGAVASGRDIAAAGSETAECLAAGPVAVTEEIEAVRSDGAGIIDLVPGAVSRVAADQGAPQGEVAGVGNAAAVVRSRVAAHRDMGEGEGTRVADSPAAACYRIAAERGVGQGT